MPKTKATSYKRTPMGHSGQSNKPTFPADEAMLVALELLEELRPVCDRAEIAGSLRRKKVRVADVEVVFVPIYKKGEKADDLFAAPPMINAAELVITKLVAQGVLGKRLNSKGYEAWGLMNKLAVHKASGIPVDLFTASAENFYNYLVCRTGPSTSNIEICQRAIAKGWQWSPYGWGFKREGTAETHRVASEREVFEFVGMEYKEPWDR